MTTEMITANRLPDRLRETVRGRVLVPGDDGYALAVRGHNLAVRHRPSVVVVAADTADVTAAVLAAAEGRVPVSVLATGHGSSAPIEGGLTVVTSRLDEIAVDPSARTLRVGAGVTWGPAIRAAEAHDLTLPAGSATSVGVVGYTLGGGLGPLGRTYGWASDWLQTIELVDPSGRLRAVDAADPDLFWALRGGKIGLGVVTAMTFDLIPLPSVVGRRAVLDGMAAATLLQRWVSTDHPSSTTPVVRLMSLPDLELVPEPLRGRHVVEVTVTEAEPAATRGSADGDAAWAALLADLPVIMEQTTTGGLTEWYAALGDPDGAMPTFQAGRLLSRLDAEGVDALLAAVHPDRRLPLMATELRLLGGRLAAASEDAVGGRDAAYLLSVIGAPEPALFPEVLPLAFATVEQRLQPWLHGGTSINFHGPVTEDNPLARAWPTATADRLAAVRRQVDPYGLFPG